ncbi:hypothetical protein CW311_17095 [Acinetobacter proteolyticus]|uniref:Uncharacterized protein n=2 Tax=Acinetobacter proteolyticus TaxID=1776741 RepID=A0A2N0WC03_9GAMM|nr:Cro/CI family transcriptional regulator [Acinetobacter proteolyticus]PKF32039.1 hypothetical protein CW311_17095 [Acinetobacter proteolyticus]
MTVDDLKTYYGVKKDFQLTHTPLKVTKGTISKWKRLGIPTDTQARIQILTDGKLKADLSGLNV